MSLTDVTGIRSARDQTAPMPQELTATTMAVARYAGGPGGWVLEAFVDGNANMTRGDARDAVARWLGTTERVALLTTKVGGANSAVDVVEPKPPPPPEFTTRAWDPAKDAPDPALG